MLPQHEVRGRECPAPPAPFARPVRPPAPPAHAHPTLARPLALPRPPQFSYEPDGSGTGGGYYKGNLNCGVSQGAEGYAKPSQIPAPGGVAQDITISFADINLVSPVTVYDIWAQKSLGQFTDSFTASQVAYHDTAFLRLTGS